MASDSAGDMMTFLCHLLLRSHLPDTRELVCESTFEIKGLNMEVQDLDKYCPRFQEGDFVSEAEFRTAAFNDSCLQSFFQQLHASLRRFNEWEEIVYTSIYIIISILAVIGNGLVILAVIRKKAMRSNRNVLILNLALSNLVLALINIPFLWLPSIDFEFPYSRFFCKFANVLPGSNIYCSTLTICVMAIDRYYSVARIKLVPNRTQCLHAVIISLIIWVLSFILSLPLLMYYDTSMLYVVKDVNVIDQNGVARLRSYGWRQCRLAPSGTSSLEMSTRSIQLMTSVLQVLSLYIVPLFVLLIFNMKLTRFLKLNANLGKNRSGGSGGRKKSPDEEEPVHRYAPQRASLAERASKQRRSRTTMLLFAMAGSYAALWLPFTLVSLLLDLDILYNEANVAVIERIDQACKMVSMLSICVNPFLYGFLNTNFRHEFKEIYLMYLRCHTKESFRNFNHEYSSYGGNTRHNSLRAQECTEEGFLTSLGRSVCSSLYKFRNSTRASHADVGAQARTGTIMYRSSSTPSHDSANSPIKEQALAGRLLLDVDSEHDSIL